MQKDIEYLGSLRVYILVMLGIFIISLVLGMIVSLKNPGLSENYFESFGQSFGWIKTLPPIAIMFIIFLNNAIKSLLTLVLGAGFGIIPVLFVAGNGIVLSMLADVVSRQHSVLFVIAPTLPHGIIEVPTVLISASIGLRLGHVMYLSLTGARTDIKLEFKQGIRFYRRIIVPLLFLAAAVETFVTPIIALSFMS